MWSQRIHGPRSPPGGTFREQTGTTRPRPRRGGAVDLVITGRIVTFDTAQPVVDDGAVYVHDGVIDAVQPRGAAAPAGFTSAPRVETRGDVYPGLIDLHNHLAYN